MKYLHIPTTYIISKPQNCFYDFAYLYIIIELYYFRKDVNCFGDDTCYSLAFGVPAILMGVATVILVIGNYTCGGYVHKPPQGSVMAQVFGSIWVS